MNKDNTNNLKWQKSKIAQGKSQNYFVILDAEKDNYEFLSIASYEFSCS